MKVKQNGAAWSQRSQQSVLEQHEVQAELVKCESLIGSVESKISELEKAKPGYFQRALHGEPYGQDWLSNTIEKLATENRTLAACKEQRAILQAKIEKLSQPDIRALETRTAQQNALAEIASRRLEKDRELDATLKALRKLLDERRELTVKMGNACFGIDLQIEDCDAQRFDELQASLPWELADGSEAWTAWFLGKRKDAKTYVVRDECLVVPENLTSHGVYDFGARIELVEQEANELLRGDRPAPRPGEPWRCVPPSITTVEAHEAAIKLAAERGDTVKDLYFWWNLRRDEEHKQRGATAPQTPASRSFKTLSVTG